MITCPVCGNAITLPTAVETLIDRGGVYGRRVTCPACRCVFSTITRVLRPSCFCIAIFSALNFS